MNDLTRLQEIHNEISLAKKRCKEITSGFKDELAQHARYQELLEELQALKIEKKSIENSVREQTPREASELEDLKIDIKSNAELLSDLAYNLLMKNETVELVDEHQNRYVPEMVVRFRKDGYVDAKED